MQEIRKLGGEGILTEEDLKELRAGRLRVAELMADGLWHDAAEIRNAAGINGIPASEGTRRLRELRELPGVLIVRRKKRGRLFEYRMIRDSIFE